MAKEVLEMEVKSNVGDVTKDVKGLGTATEGASGSFGKLGTAVKGMGTALKAAGIGLIVAAFMALKEALERNQKVMNTVNSVMSAVSTTFNQVVDVLVDTYNWVTKSTERFDGLGKVLKGIITLALTPLKTAFFGLKLGVEQLQLAWAKLNGSDDAKLKELREGIQETKDTLVELKDNAIEAGKNIVTNFGDAIGEIGAIGERVIDGVSKVSVKANFEQAKATIAAQNSAKLAEAGLQGLIEKNDLLAEKQRQIRDDETKTFAERIEANKELGRVLEQQEVDMLKLADTRVAAAAFELAQNKDNIDLQVAYQQTLNDRAGVEAQVAGFRSEQLTNEVSLQKELLETQKEIIAEGLEGMAQELEELKTSYEAKVEMARKAGMDITDITEQYQKDQTKITEDYAKQQTDIEKAKTQATQDNINSQLSAFSGLAGALGALAGESKELAVGQAIVDTYVGANKAFAQGGTVGFVTAAAVIAAGLANVQKILSTPVGDGGGGGGGGVEAPPAPQMMSGAFDISGGVAPEAVKAYVVTDEMSNSQNQLANIRRRATI
mgnify:FL=1|jgi:hypothetical protein|tara:strand:- start:1209 stop:2861 length:1653 start_codon:yes stop_codon:yes gene_type:complete